MAQSILRQSFVLDDAEFISRQGQASNFPYHNKPLRPQREVDLSPFSVVSTGLHGVERWNFFYIELFFLLDFLIKTLYTFIVCVMLCSLHSNISGTDRCITLWGRCKLGRVSICGTVQSSTDSTVQYCPTPSVRRAYETYLYKSEVKGWESACHESSSSTGRLTPLQRLGLQMTTAHSLDRTPTVIVHCLPQYNCLHPSFVMSCFCRMCK